MEATMVKPEVKKKPKPPKPPPKPAEFKPINFERPARPTPLMPPRPTDSELTHTQYRIKKAAAPNNEASGNFIQRKAKEKPPVVLPRATEKELNATTRQSHRSRVHTPDTQSSRERNQSEVPKDESDFKQSNQTVLTGIFRRSQKEKTPSFTSYLTDDRDKEAKSDDVPTKQAPDNKPGSLRGATKGLQVKAFTKARTGLSPDPSDGIEGSEKEQSTEKNKQEQNAEPKQDIGGLISGIFRKPPKDKLPPSLTVNVAEEDPEDEEEKSSKLSSENLSINSELSASSDSLSKNSNKEKGGFFSGMFKKPHKPTETAQTDEDQLSQHDSLSGSNDNLSENSKEKGGFFSGMLRKSPKVPREETPGKDKPVVEADPSEDNETLSENNNAKGSLSVNSELSASSDSLSENNSNKEKGGFFSGMFKKPPKPTETAQTDEDQLSQHDSLSGSNDNLSENSKEKGGFFSGMLRKSPKVPREETPGKDKPVVEADPSEDNETLSENNNAKGSLSVNSELSASSDSLSENNSNKEKGGFFSGMLRKSPKVPREETPGKDKQLLEADPSEENETENNNAKEKGGLFSGMFKKSPKLSEAPRLEEGEESLHDKLSVSTDSLSENKEKGSLFSGLLRKTPKTTGEENLQAQKDLSASSNSLSETTKTKEKQSQDVDLSSSSETLSEQTNTKDKGGIFSGIFKKAPKPAEPAQPEEGDSPDNDLSASNENVTEIKAEKGAGLFGGLLKKTPKASGDRTELLDKEAQRELSTSNDDLSESNTTKEKSIFSNMFKKPQKPPEGATAQKELTVTNENSLSVSCENLSSTTTQKEKKGGLAGIFKRSASIDNLFDEEKGGLFSGLIKKTPKASELEASAEELNHDDNKMLFSSSESLPEAATTKEKKGGLTGIFKKSPRPAPRSTTTTDPLHDMEGLSDSRDILLESAEERKGGLGGIFRRTPKVVEPQESVDTEEPRAGGLTRRRTIKKKRRVVSFRVKKTKTPKPVVTQSSDTMPIIDEAVEMQDMRPAQVNEDSSDELEVQTVEMAAYPTKFNPLESELENDELMEWWNTVKGWVEWNETNNFGEDDGQYAVEQAADRVYMAARLFVRLFNQRGASLQHRILELLALADAADQFHKKTVSAAIGGGVASVAGSVATITGLILAPFTFGASIIVTAVGIGVATAGSITSATANITDTVHSNMDRKKLEKMIQEYQEEIKVIRECLEFLQAGMDALQEWDFERYSESAAKKAMNHNLKHVMKEGGRAGKALMINTDKLISTVQILGVAGGAAKAAQAISVTTGVMSALFLALDVFFLAKDSHELRKGAKTKFATKIRDVCKDLQDGLLELNKVKTQLQKTMDGIEVEEYEEIEEVEVEEDDDFESDPKKLAELEQELDILEEKLDMKAKEEQEKSKVIELEKESLKKDQEKNEEKSFKENKESKDKVEKGEVKEEEKKEEKKGKDEGENKLDSKLEKITDKEKKKETVKAAQEEGLKEQSQKERKKDKETENRLTVGREKKDKSDTAKESSIKSKTDEEEKSRNKTGKEPEEVKSRSGNSKQDHPSGKTYSERPKTERENERSKSGREEERVVSKEAESVSMRRHSSNSDKDRPQRRESKQETKGMYEDRVSGRQSERTESWRRREKERGVRSEGVEMVKSRERSDEGRESKTDVKREDHGKNDGRKESHQSQETSWRRERSEREGGREESGSKRSQEKRGTAPHEDQSERRDEKRESRVESMKSHFGEAESEERKRRREDGGSQRKDRERRGSDRVREHGHSHRGSRSQSTALLEDGLNI